MPLGHDVPLKLPAMINTVILFVIFIKLARQIVQNVSFISITRLLSRSSLGVIKIYNEYQTMPSLFASKGERSIFSAS